MIDNYFAFLTNNYDIEAEEVIKRYKLRWREENFFKELKHGRWALGKFPGTKYKKVRTHIITILLMFIYIHMFKQTLCRREHKRAELKRISNQVLRQRVGILVERGIIPGPQTVYPEEFKNPEETTTQTMLEEFYCELS